MFNLLIKFNGWANARDTIPTERLFEYTSPSLAGRLRTDSTVDYAKLRGLPALFVQESTRKVVDHVVRVGTILGVQPGRRDLAIEYAYDPEVPPFNNADLQSMASELGIDSAEFTRTHWAIKEADLFRVLMRHLRRSRSTPRVFSIADPERIEPSLVSSMMPFATNFDPVHLALKEAAKDAGLRYRRADDIWENPAVIQDVVSLIDRSRIVVCDCSDEDYGGREYSCRDPEGHVWNCGSYDPWAFA